MESNVRVLPNGWRREELAKRSGLTTGKTEIFYVSPEGIRVNNKASLAKVLGKRYDITLFDFRSGKMINTNRKRGRAIDMNLALPIRQTASIFKQPVTVIRNMKGHVKSMPQQKTSTQTPTTDISQPRQLFWEKRLSGMKACDNHKEPLETLKLPSCIKTVGPNITSENTLQSISASLHANVKITGQKADPAIILKDPHLNITFDQPLMQQTVITDYDITAQEVVVNEARLKLQNLLAIDRHRRNMISENEVNR